MVFHKVTEGFKGVSYCFRCTQKGLMGISKAFQVVSACFRRFQPGFKGLKALSSQFQGGLSGFSEAVQCVSEDFRDVLGNCMCFQVSSMDIR